MPYWDERFAAMGKHYPDIRTDQFHIDILCAHFVQHPDWFDVVVGSNLFGDILSDLGPAVAGSIGIAAVGQHQPGDGRFPRCSSRCMARRPTSPASTSATRSARSGRPALMLEHLGEKAAAARRSSTAIETLLREGGPRTRDMGGQAGTADVGQRLGPSGRRALSPYPLLAGAGFIAGAMNAIAGGGSFVTFPALVFVGVPSINANVTSTVALFPGSFASAWAYRREFNSSEGLSVRALLPVSLAGGLAGALLLLLTPVRTFDAVVPWLLLLGTLAFAFGRQAGRRCAG